MIGRMVRGKSLKETTMLKKRCMETLKKRTSKLRDENKRLEAGKIDSGRRLLNTY